MRGEWRMVGDELSDPLSRLACVWRAANRYARTNGPTGMISAFAAPGEGYFHGPPGPERPWRGTRCGITLPRIAHLGSRSRRRCSIFARCVPHHDAGPMGTTYALREALKVPGQTTSGLPHDVTSSTTLRQEGATLFVSLAREWGTRVRPAFSLFG